MKKIIFICLIATTPFYSHGQKQYVDSLMHSLKAVSADTIKMQLAGKLRDYYMETNYDSALYYGYQV